MALAGMESAGKKGPEVEAVGDIFKLREEKVREGRPPWTGVRREQRRRRRTGRTGRAPTAAACVGGDGRMGCVYPVIIIIRGGKGADFAE